MADGTPNPDRPHDRRGDDHGQRRPALIPDAVQDRFPGGEWLDPLAEGITRGLELLDRARLALVLVAGAVVLLYVGAKIERHQLKSRLAVLDGAPASADVDVSEGARGRRS